MTTLTRWIPLSELPIERRMRRMLDDIGFGPFMSRRPISTRPAMTS